MKRRRLFVALSLLVGSATVVAAAELQTATSISEHEVRLDAPVAGRRFPSLGGELLAPAALEGASFPVPVGVENVIACVVHVENGGVPRKKVRAKLATELTFKDGGQSERGSETRKTNLLGTAFFHFPVVAGGIPRSVAWTTELSRKMIDTAWARCQMRSFTPCAETDEVGCVAGRFAVKLANAASLGGGAFDLQGERVDVAVRNSCQRQSLLQVLISVDDLDRSRNAVLDVRDAESGAVLRRNDLTLQARTTINLSWPDTRCDPHTEGCRSPCP